MRVLLTSVPAVAHVLPLLPLARGLHRRGHEAAILTDATMAPLLPPEVALLEVGPDLVTLLGSVRGRFADLPAVEPASDVGIGRFFGTHRVEQSLDAALDVGRRWAPDLVLGEGLDVTGLALAAALDVPHATVTLGPVCSAGTVGAMRAHTEDLGYALADTTWFDTWPDLLRPPGWEPPAPARRLRTSLGLEPAGPPRRFVPDGEGPAVLLSLGTLFDETEVVAALLDALVAAGARVACVLGPRHDAEAVAALADAGADPARVRVHRFAPLGSVLEEVDAVVCHGGAGTVLAALAAGRPVVALPQGADHALVASGLAASGAGAVRPPDAPPADVAAALREVLGRREAAADVAAEIAGMPDADVVARDLEELAGQASR